MPRHTEHSKSREGTDWKVFLIVALAVLLAASVYTKGFSKAPAAVVSSNASEVLDLYLRNFGQNDTVAGLREIKAEAEQRIYKIQIENDPQIQLVVISDSGCSDCDTDRVIEVSRQLFPRLEVDGVIDYNSTGGKLIAKRYGITLLPAYIYSNSIEQAANFRQVAPDLIKVGSDYVIDPRITGASFPVY